MDYVLAQVNVARLRAPLDSPLLADFVANLDPVNATADAALQALVNFISLLPGSTLTDQQKETVIAADANAHVVAQCAMKVQRNAEVGAEQSFLPPESCGCYWESIATGSSPTTSAPNSSTTSVTSFSLPPCSFSRCAASRPMKSPFFRLTKRPRPASYGP